MSHMVMWAVLAAPLLAGNNLTAMTPDVKSILTNKDLIAIDQDALGKQGDRVWGEGPLQIWTRPLADGSTALAIFNFGEDVAEMRGMRLHLKEAGLPPTVHARNILEAKDLGTIKDADHFSVPRHGVVLLKVSR